MAARLSFRADLHSVVLAAWVLAAMPAAAGAAWTTFQGDAAHTGYVPGHLDPRSFEELWHVGYGMTSTEHLQPVAAGDGKVFLAKTSYCYTPSEVRGFDARSGQLLWTRSIPDIPGLSPAAYTDGRVYAHASGHSSVPPAPTVYCYDANTGKTLFAAAHLGQWDDHGVPTLYGGSLYTSGRRNGGLDAYDAGTGRVLWSRDMPQQYGWSPAVDGEHVYVYIRAPDINPGRLYVIDRLTGDLDFEIRDPNSGWNLGQQSNPALGSGSDAFVINEDRLIRFDLASRGISWERPGNYTGGLALADGRLFTIEDGELIVLEEDTGDPLWSWSAGPGSGLRGNLVVTDSHVFTSSGTHVFAVDRDLREGVWSAAGVSGDLAIADGLLFVTENGGLYVYQVPEPTSLSLLALGGLAVARGGRPRERRATGSRRRLRPGR
jgi:outer membrane protein assembly factor BamB